ncbi:MAG: hypothetical protein AB8I08_04600 [Sandaracinaceae bacterium]
MRSFRLALFMGALLGIVSSLPAVTSAQDGEDGELRLMREPHSYVDIADAFDDEDPFDLNVTVGFERNYTYGNIQREGNAGAGDPDRASRNWQDVAHHTHQRNLLNVGLQIGIFRDLMIYGNLPIILSDDRSLGRVAGARDGAEFIQADADGDGDPSNDPPLYQFPFQSPTRSGLDYIGAGIGWSILNQTRDRSTPTWILMVEGRFNLGDPLVACNGTGGGAACRNWNESGGAWNFSDTGTDAGETRGTNALRIETRASWRTRYVEPFAGLSFQIEWPANSERFFLPAGDVSGFINSQPPIVGAFTGGMAVIPWENRAAFQRFAIDMRLMGKYVSEGHGYSPLFDALGTSQSPYLNTPNLEGEPNGDPNLRQVPFFGLTDVQPHAQLGARLGLEMRAARYVRFSLAAALWYIQPYIITYADACNPNVTAADGDPRRGTCRRGIINPHHRPVIDLPGQAFRVDEQVQLDIVVNATGMF